MSLPASAAEVQSCAWRNRLRALQAALGCWQAQAAPLRRHSE